MKMTVKIENYYPGDSRPITNVESIDVPAPPTEEGEERDDWAYDHLFPLTGTGRTEGDAGYFVEITECPDDPLLVGTEFEWGT